MKIISLDRDEIEKLIPHRYPMSFLREVKIKSGKEGSSKAIWEKNHPAFAGHFPDFAIVPGVFLIEAAAQLASVIAAYKLKTEAKRNNRDFIDKNPSEYVGVLSGVRKTLLHKPVFPDQEVTMTQDGTSVIDIPFAEYNPAYDLTS